MSPISRLYHSVIYWTPILHRSRDIFPPDKRPVISSVYVCVFNVTNALAKQSLFYHANKAVERNSRGRKRRESKKESCFSFVLALWRQSLSSCVLILDGQMRLQATPDVFGERARERACYWPFLWPPSRRLVSSFPLSLLGVLPAERGAHTGCPGSWAPEDSRRERLILILPPHSDCLMSFTISPSFSFSLSIALSETPTLSWALSLSLSLSL